MMESAGRNLAHLARVRFLAGVDVKVEHIFATSEIVRLA
jgi:hypothetical protein